MPGDHGAAHLVAGFLGVVHVLVKNVGVRGTPLLHALHLAKSHKLALQIFFRHLRAGGKQIETGREGSGRERRGKKEKDRN